MNLPKDSVTDSCSTYSHEHGLNGQHARVTEATASRNAGILERRADSHDVRPFMPKTNPFWKRIDEDSSDSSWGVIFPTIESTSGSNPSTPRIITGSPAFNSTPTESSAASQSDFLPAPQVPERGSLGDWRRVRERLALRPARRLRTYHVGERLRGPDMGTSKADLVRVHNVISHTVIFLFTQLPPGIPDPGTGFRTITAVRIHPGGSYPFQQLYDAADLANERGPVVKITIWTNRVYDFSKRYMDYLRLWLLRHPIDPDVRYYDFVPGTAEALPPILEFGAVQSTRDSYWRISEDR